MSTSGGGQTKNSLLGGGIDIPSPTAGTDGTSPQNSPPATFDPTISDIGPNLGVLSRVSLLPPSNKPGLGDALIATSIPSHSPTKPSVMSMPPVLLGQQTPSLSHSLATLPYNFRPTTSAFLSSNFTEPVSTSSSTPTDSTASTSKSNSSALPETTTSAPTSMTSSSRGGFISSVSSSVLPPAKFKNYAKSSTTISSSAVPTDSTASTSKHDGPQTTTSAPVLTSSQEGYTTPASSSISSSDAYKHAEPSTNMSLASTNNIQTSPRATPPSSPSSTEDSSHTAEMSRTHTATIPSSHAPRPTKSPNTMSPGTKIGGSPMTVPSAKQQSPSGSLADTPRPTVNGITSVKNPSEGSSTTLVAQPSDDPAGTHSSTALGFIPTVSLVGTSSSAISVVHGAKPVSAPPPVDVEGSSATPTTDYNRETLSSTLSYITTTIPVTVYSPMLVSGTSTSVLYTCMTTITSSTWIPTLVPSLKSGARSNEATVVGGVIGAVLALLVLSVAACYFIRRRRHSRYHLPEQLHDRDLTAPLPPEAVEIMRETRATYNLVGGKIMGESQDDMHRASSPFVPSAFTFAFPSHTPNSSGSVFHDDVSVWTDGCTSSSERSEGTGRYSVSAQSLFVSNDWKSGESVGVGIAIGSESGMGLFSYHTAAVRLAPVSRTPVDDDESPGPSPSSFPAPPGSIFMNPSLDTAQIADYLDSMTSRTSHSKDAVSAASEAAVLAPKRNREQQTSWTAAVVASSPMDAQTPKATRSLDSFTDAIDVFNDSSSRQTQIPTQTVMSFHNPYNPSSSVNPLFLHEMSQDGLSDDSRSSYSHETVSDSYMHSESFEFRDTGKGKVHLSAYLMDGTKRNRLSNASSGLEFPENSSQCGVAL